MTNRTELQYVIDVLTDDHVDVAVGELADRSPTSDPMAGSQALLSATRPSSSPPVCSTC